jgi:hypothetical protein
MPHPWPKSLICQLKSAFNLWLTRDGVTQLAAAITTATKKTVPMHSNLVIWILNYQLYRIPLPSCSSLLSQSHWNVHHGHHSAQKSVVRKQKSEWRRQRQWRTFSSKTMHFLVNQHFASSSCWQSRALVMSSEIKGEWKENVCFEVLSELADWHEDVWPPALARKKQLDDILSLGFSWTGVVSAGWGCHIYLLAACHMYGSRCTVPWRQHWDQRRSKIGSHEKRELFLPGLQATPSSLHLLLERGSSNEEQLDQTFWWISSLSGDLVSRWRRIVSQKINQRWTILSAKVKLWSLSSVFRLTVRSNSTVMWLD